MYLAIRIPRWKDIAHFYFINILQKRQVFMRNLKQALFLSVFRKLKVEREKTQAQFWFKKLKILGSTYNFVQKSKGKLTLKDPLLPG